MRKTPSLILVLFVMAICSCSLVAEKKPADWPALQWENQSVTLRIVGYDGKPISAYNGRYLSLPGYIFVADRISLHPGTHRISYSCPGEWDWKMVSHYVPAVEHKFEVGNSYELYCVDGYPKIRISD